MVSFIQGNFQNYYSSPAIRKNDKTIPLFEKAISAIIDASWEVPPKAAWFQSGKNQQYYENHLEAISELTQRKYGALFINFFDPKTLDLVFVRWYNSSPQQDILSIEASFTILQGELIEVTPLLRAEELAQQFHTFFSKISDSHTRSIDPLFMRMQQLSLLSETLIQPSQRVHKKKGEKM